MNSPFLTMIRSITCSIAFMLFLTLVQSGLPEKSVFSNAVEAKTAKSPYKKTFARSKRINSKKSRKRSSSVVV